MRSRDVLLDGFGRVHAIVHQVVDGLSPDELAARVDGRANSIGWLVWHLTRIQDDHVADVADLDQVWLTSGWRDNFDLPFDPGDTGYGHRREQVAAVRVGSSELLTGYFDAVHEQTLRYVRTLTDPDLDAVVDTSWDPPVTLGVRLVSVMSDDLQHAGQAAFARGLVRG